MAQDSGQAGAPIQITKEAFETAYNLWWSGLEDVEFPNPLPHPGQRTRYFEFFCFKIMPKRSA